MLNDGYGSRACDFCCGIERQKIIVGGFRALLPLPVLRERVGVRAFFVSAAFFNLKQKTLTLTLSRSTGRGKKTWHPSTDNEPLTTDN